jgi:hypothetical protein
VPLAVGCSTALPIPSQGPRKSSSAPVLLLNPTLVGPPPHSTPVRDGYALAVPQGGFEVVAGLLRPLIRGSDLDAYAGQNPNEVIYELKRKQKL